MNLAVYIGHDEREPQASRVAAKSLAETSRIEARLLRGERLRAAGLLWRLTDRRDGLLYDLVSNAPCSTDFAISRFVVPIIHLDGWALFADGDVVFMRDVGCVLDHADPRYAVMVVKHLHEPSLRLKMDGRAQLRYARKNWSSVMLFNCSHPANQRLSLRDVNERTGLELHRFYWLNDDEIGALPARFNWLVNEEPMPEECVIAHFTNGCPALPGWKPHDHDDIWLRAAGSVEEIKE
jgi:hypothetical protein